MVDKLLSKAQEAFVMAIEVYNKPTIKYRIEGFSFFICNAWELMLKAHLIKKHGEDSIYFRDNPNRTLSLENCVQKVFTNETAPLRKNLEKIIALRNTSTHFITEEYEMVYVPLFQACVFNFNDKMQEFHGIDMTQIIPQNFLTLAVSMSALNDSEIRAKYPGIVGEKLVQTSQEIKPMIEESAPAFAIRIDHHHYITKKREEATEVMYIDRNATSSANIIKELKDPNVSYNYTVKKCVQEIIRRLTRLNIQLMYAGSPVQFNKAHFNDIVKYYGIKDNNKLCFAYMVSTNPQYSYSIQAIDFIVDEIKKDPSNILDNIRSALKTKRS